MEDNIMTIDELRKETLLKALNKFGTIDGAASLMGISKRTAWRWKKSYRVKRDQDTGAYIVVTRTSKKPAAAITSAALVVICFLASCCPARDPHGGYWKPWDVPHRMFAVKSTPSNHQSDCPKEP